MRGRKLREQIRYFAGVHLLVQYISVIFVSFTDMENIQLKNDVSLYSEQ